MIKNALTKNEFRVLYDKCSSVLHACKPYNLDSNEVDFQIAPIDWLNKVRNLLNIHYVCLPNNKGYWLCLMKDPSDFKPHVYTLELKS